MSNWSSACCFKRARSREMRCCSSALHISVPSVFPSLGLIEIQNASDIGRDDSAGGGERFSCPCLAVNPVNLKQRHRPSSAKREAEAAYFINTGTDDGSATR